MTDALNALAYAAPLMPTALAQQWGTDLLWGVVLAWLALNILNGLGAAVGRLNSQPRRPSQRWQWTVIGAVMALSMVPGVFSPAYWLSLSFQSPSLVLASVAGYGVWAQLTHADRGPWQAHGPLATVLCSLGVGLGWLLMLDTLAFWPRSVYALGFGTPVLIAAGAAVVALGWWAARKHGALPALQPLMAVVVLAALLVVFAVTRLPTGNVWDALSDPLLWVGLHFKLARDGLTSRRAKTKALA